MLSTNVDSLVKMKLRGEVIHPELWVERGYATTWDGRPKLTVGIGGVVHNVMVSVIPYILPSLSACPKLARPQGTAWKPETQRKGGSFIFDITNPSDRQEY